ncbi:MAG: hypothetical protein RR359_04405 [Bacilli bacterium]
MIKNKRHKIALILITLAIITVSFTESNSYVKTPILSRSKIHNRNNIAKNKKDKIKHKPKKSKYNGYKKVNLKLTFYTDLSCENTEEYGGVDAIGNKLTFGTVANNYYPIGTEIKIGDNNFTVSDRGGNGFNNYYNLDVFIPREYGENDDNYYKRINSMGVKEVVGYVKN